VEIVRLQRCNKQWSVPVTDSDHGTRVPGEQNVEETGWNAEGYGSLMRTQHSLAEVQVY